MRRLLRAAVWVVACLLVARELLAAYHDYMAWHTTVDDPSGRDAYLTFLELDIALAIGVMILAIVSHWLLGWRASPRAARPGA